MKRLTTATLLSCTPLLLTLVAVAANACSESPTEPAEPQSEAPITASPIPTSSVKPIVPGELLDDPLVQLLVANLEDPAAAQSLHSSLDEYTAALDGPEGATLGALAIVQAALDGYAGTPSLSPDDEIALAVLGLVLDAAADAAGAE